MTGSTSVWLWLSETVLPVDGADIVVLLRGTGGAIGDPRRVFGARAAVDRWDGARWAHHRDASLCLDFWGCVGRLTAPGRGGAGRAIGLTPGRHGGAATLLTVDGLVPGRYRLRQSSTSGELAATGVFEVRDGVVHTVPLGLRDAERLLVAPSLVGTAGGVLAVSRLVRHRGTVDVSTTSIPRELDLQAWADGSWVDVEPVQVAAAVRGDGRSGQSTVSLGQLRRSAYRLIDRGSRSEAQGVFWVTDD